jgi:hypothetical protein
MRDDEAIDRFLNLRQLPGEPTRQRVRAPNSQIETNRLDGCCENVPRSTSSIRVSTAGARTAGRMT